MKSFLSFTEAKRRSKIRQDSKTGDEDGINTKNNTVGTVNITDEKIDEARGRPKKNPTSEDPGSDNIIMQLRKVITLRGQEPVKFVNGQKLKLSPAFAHHLLAKYDALKTSGEKHAFSMRIHKSAESMRDVASGKAEPKKSKVSLAGRITGTQNENLSSAVNPVRTTPVNIGSTPTVKEPNAPSSATSLQKAADQRRKQLDTFAQKQTELQTKQREVEVKKRQGIAKSNDKIQKAKQKSV